MTAPTFGERLVERVGRANLQITDSEVRQFERYYGLLERWNRSINLTALALAGYPPATIDRLLVEPLIAAKLVRHEGLNWFDLGSGGGSPAIPLKVARPHLSLSMVESRARKAAFLREVIRTLELGNARVVADRIENLSQGAAGSVDLVTVRGVRMDQVMFSAAVALLREGGQLLWFTAVHEVLSDTVPGLALVGKSPLPALGTLVVNFARRA